MRILLIGLMGSGKSTIGRRLSAETGWPYLDNDTLLPELTGQTAPELIAQDGEAALHAAEFAAFEHALAAPEPTVIGVAGWVVTVPEGRTKLRDAGVVVWLRGRPETLRHVPGPGEDVGWTPSPPSGSARPPPSGSRCSRKWRTSSSTSTAVVLATSSRRSWPSPTSSDAGDDG